MIQQFFGSNSVHFESSNILSTKKQSIGNKNHNSSKNIRIKRSSLTSHKLYHNNDQFNNLTIERFNNHQRYKSVQLVKFKHVQVICQSKLQKKLENKVVLQPQLLIKPKINTQNTKNTVNKPKATKSDTVNILNRINTINIRNNTNQFVSNIKYQFMLGKGGFSTVHKVSHTIDNKEYALKKMLKSTVITKRSIPSILNQKNLLSKLKHTFLINMIKSFQDQNHLYLLMDLKQGGDLRYHLTKQKSFHQYQTKFMIVTIVLCLQYLHTKGVAHRDLKPENIVFDTTGYAYLTDLGIAKSIHQITHNQTSGTPGYMAPQVLFHQNHGVQVDFFALGVIIYQIIMKKRPYRGKSRDQIRQHVRTTQIIITKKQIPEQWSLQSADFVNKLLQRKPINRLGWGGIHQIKNHCWLENVPWQKFINKNIESPKKRLFEHLRVQYKKSEPRQEYLQLLFNNQLRIQRGELQSQFINFTYQNTDENKQLQNLTQKFSK